MRKYTFIFFLSIMLNAQQTQNTETDRLEEEKTLNDGMQRLEKAKEYFYAYKFIEAKEELKQILKKHKRGEVHQYALLISAHIEHKLGNNKKSKEILDVILRENQNNEHALELRKEVIKAMSLYVDLNLEYGKDDQPLESFSEKVEIGRFVNQFFNPFLKITNRNFDTSKNVLYAELGNHFMFDETDTYIRLSAGVHKNFSNDLDFIGNIAIKQNLMKHVALHAEYKRQAYLATMVSTEKNYMENIMSAAIEYDNSKLFTLRAEYQGKSYGDDSNFINSMGAWILSKPFKISAFELRAGYGYGYSNAEKLRFSPKKDIGKLVQEYPAGSEVPGRYDVYFSPIKQKINSVIASIAYSPTTKLSMGVQGSYGFSASAYNPTLILEENEHGIFDTKLYQFKDTYHPYEIKAHLKFNLTEKLNLTAYYQHYTTYFFDQDIAGITAHYTF